MKKIVIITLFSYLLYSTLPAFAAAPPAAGAGSSSMRAVENQLTDWWTLYHTMPDALAEQLAQNYLAQNDNPRPSMQTLEAFFNEGGGHMLPPSIVKQVHSNIHKRNPIIIVPSIKFEGDYDAFSQALLAKVQSTLHGQEGSYVLVNLCNNNLGDIESELLSQLIQGIHRHVISMNCHLFCLNLCLNRLTILPPKIFNGLQDLLILDLSANELTTLPAGIFDGLGNLRHLYLSYNQLITLPSRVFYGLDNLQHLFLIDNQLTTLEPGIFNDLQKLRLLLLDGNQITTLPAEIFDGLGNLRILGLARNPIASDAAAVEELQRQLPKGCTIRKTR